MIEFEEAVTGLARRDDPETSHEAAALVDASGLMREIYFAMLQFGENGCISDDVSDALPHLENQTFTPRFIQMIQRGYIEKTGEKRRGSHNGRMQDVRRACFPPFSPPLNLKQQRCCPHCGGLL